MAKKRKATKKRFRKTFKIEVGVDFSEWGGTAWIDMLEKLFVPMIEGCNVSYEISVEMLEKVSNEIATDAVKAFFEEDLWFDLTNDGLEIGGYNTDPVMVPLQSVVCSLTGEARAALSKKLATQKDEASYDDPEYLAWDAPS